MVAVFQAVNATPFEYDYVDSDGAAINVSTATEVLLYLYFPTRTTKVVEGEIQGTNKAYALVESIVNSDLGIQQSRDPFLVNFEFCVTVAGKQIWSPVCSQTIYMNIG